MRIRVGKNRELSKKMRVMVEKIRVRVNREVTLCEN